MTSSLLGMSVTRVIPDSVLAGLAIGQYMLHGSVIRWAAGTPQAGQIVCHLLPAAASTAKATLFGGGFTPRLVPAATSIVTAAMPIMAGITMAASIASTVLGGVTVLNTYKILKAARRTMELAEMNLAATQAGFASLDQRLTQLEAKLDEIKVTTTAILKLLQMTQRAELRVALDHLNRIGLINDEHVRCKLLVHSAETLGKLGLIYEQRLSEANTLAEMMICEEYYCIAMLAQVRCYAELHELPMARHILHTTHEHWHLAARNIMKHHLLGENPEKYLGCQFAVDVPMVELAEWLDFAHGESKGLAWIDELRAKADPWYYYKELPGLPATRRMGRVSERDEILVLHKTIVIPAMQKLVARHSVFEAYITQYAVMEQHQLTVSEFEVQIAAVAPDDQVDGFVILMRNVEVPA